MFTFESDVPRDSTSLALAKSLALQLLDVRVGNVGMFDAIFEAYNHPDSASIEAYLWTAIDAAFSKSSEPTMIIVDGLDQVKGENVTAICDHISELSSKHASLKSIILSRPNAALKANAKKWKVFEIKPDHVYEDVQHVARRALGSCGQFVIQKESERHVILERLVKSADGSFLWLLLAIHMLKNSKSIEDFGKTLTESPKTLDEMIKKHAGLINFSDPDTKLMLSMILVAERPLTTHELHDVLQVDLQKKTNTGRPIDIKEKLSDMGGLLLVDENEVIKFRHSAIRSFFVAIHTKGERIMNSKDAQTEITLRLLAYSKGCLTKKHEIRLEVLPFVDVERAFTEHNLLEYAVRNWTYHFRQSSLFKSTGSLELSPDSKAVFPTSPLVVLLEWTAWDEQASGQEIVDMHDLSLRIRSEVFDQKHECTLQNIIVCGFVHQEYSPALVAAQYFFRASYISQAILPKFNKVTIACTIMFLTITETIKFTSRTETVTHREEMLRFLIKAYKHEHGETSDTVIHYYKTLAELYTVLQEEEKAAECWKQLRIIIIKKHGEGSDAEREISGKLMVVLKEKQDFEIEQYRGDIFAVGEESTIVWDATRIAVFLQMARAHEHREEWYEAEEIYVTLWSRLLHLSKYQDSHDIDLRISVLKVAVEYARFLHRRQRDEEAKNILIVVWTEYQHFGCESTEFYVHLKEIGQLMRDLDLGLISISVFEKIVQWFQAVGKHDHEEVRSCERYIIEGVDDFTNKPGFRKDETTEEIDIIVRRMFSSTTVVTKEYIKITRTAAHLYIRREQWPEAIAVLTKALALMWRESSWGGELCLPAEFTDEAVEFAIELGRCYMKCKHYQESLTCYLQLWQAVRSASKFQDKRRRVIVDALIDFYTEHKRWKLLIELRRELLVDYRR